ncbi:hypothetical protein LTR08_002727 [Meristemomyces frigidus]|nr:hypothetical protein LTR08_002727 [Meristemomyces frigidus]
MLRYITLRSPPLPPFHLTTSRHLATKRGSEIDEAALLAARHWLTKLTPSTIPQSIGSVTFSRSSGPGGQNVNKVSSKATLRVPLPALLPLLPSLLHPHILTSRYHAPKSHDLVIQADESRKQSDNATACFARLHAVLVQAGQAAVPGETSEAQSRRVVGLQRKEAAGRRRLKEFVSGKKSARRGGGGGRGED